VKLPHAIETLSGGMFDFDRPQADQVDIGDIATALGNTCRFGGHVKRYYSVAEHALLVYRLVKNGGFPPDVCYAALHHDSHEAYLGDIPTPLKRTLGRSWKRRAAKVDTVICDQLGIAHELMEHDAVKAADSMALSYEAAILKPSGRAQRHGAWLQMDASEVPVWAVLGHPPEQAAYWFAEFHEAAQQEAWS
jgi:hypothetical protein